MQLCVKIDKCGSGSVTVAVVVAVDATLKPLHFYFL
jgi:hypothetical protein